jgi:hypothetical protein
LRGVRPWPGGLYLTSVGLSDLDTILGGGQPLGTAILLEEDRWTRDLAISLVKYWCAEVRWWRKEASTKARMTDLSHCRSSCKLSFFLSNPHSRQYRKTNTC